MKNTVAFIAAGLLAFAASAQPFSGPEFLSSTPFEIGNAALIDLEGDGDLDALVGGIGFNASGIEMWKNTNGIFQQVNGNIPFSQFGALAFSVGDIDMDGDQDFATVIQDNLVWYANDGTGLFASPATVASAVGDIRSISLGDLDGNPGLELVITRLDAEDVLAYANDGAGNFGSPITVTTQSVDPIDALIGDFNGDGLNDIAVACLNSCDVTWHENLGGLLFSSQNALGGDQIGTYKLALADFDSNGHLDIASVGFGSDDLSVFFNAGLGIFGPRTVISTSVDGATNLTAGDFNDDGLTDMVVGAENTNVITYFENDGFGNFTELAIPEAGSVDNPESYLAGDVDGDGKIDLVTASQDDNKLAYHLQKPGAIASGTNPFLVQQLINKPAAGVNDLTSADIDGDGLKDLVSTERASGRVTWYQNESTGTLGVQNTLLQLSEGLSGLDAGDMDGDGNQDLAVANIGDSTITVFFNEGGGTSFTAVTVDQDLDEPYAPFLVDLDNDGDLDIIQASGWDAQVYIYPNNGDRTFSTRITLCEYCLFSTSVSAQDLNGDGLPEILVYVGQNQEIEIYENLGGLTFGDSELIIDSFNGVRDIDYLDYDNDGDLDVFATSIFVNRIKYAENLGNLNFAPEAEVPFGFGFQGTHDLEILDVDLDGDMDIAVTEFFNNRLSVVFVEAGSFVQKQTFDNPYETPTSLVAEDFDGDGKEDLTACFRNYVGFYKNEALNCASLQPQNLDVAITATSVNFSWDPVPGTVACRITLDGNGQTVKKNIIQPEPSGFSAPLSFFQSGSSYYWRVQCACSLNPTEPTGQSQTDFFFVPSQLVVFPNPASDHLRVQFNSGSEPSGNQFRVSDIQGRVLLQGIYTGQIDIESLDAGYYFLETKGETTKFFKK